MQFVVRWGLGLIPLFVLVGCNSDPGPRAAIEKVVPASGMLTFQGKPLDHYQVTLRPDDDRRPATGITDKDGKFTLGTNAAGDGCPPGKHKVAVVWMAPADDGLGNVIDDPSKLPKAPVKLPPKYGNPDTSDITVEVPEGGSQELKIDLK